MSHEFSAFELVVTALLLDRRLTEHHPEIAFVKARDLLDRASEFQKGSVSPELGFLEAIEAGIPADLGGEKGRAEYRAEVRKVYEGGHSDQVLILNRNGAQSSFDEYLRNRAASKKLRQRKFSGHLQKLEEHKIDYFRVHKKGELASIIISKENADTYLELERGQIRADDSERQRKSRQNKTQRDKPVNRRNNL